MNERDTKNLPDQVDTCSAKAWRISQGKILRGRKGEEEERGVMLGYLRRIGTHYGTLDDGPTPNQTRQPQGGGSDPDEYGPFADE